jgi:predicted CXXCH cytochrome family protein
MWSAKMPKTKLNRRQTKWLVFTSIFGLCLVLGAAAGLAEPVVAAPPSQEGTAYAGSSSCAQCHEDLHTDWITTRHSQAFSSPIFQRDWDELHQQTSCLECHTTGYDPATGNYAEEGVTCESCHGAFQPNHPTQNMSITPDADLCSNCHKNTTDEWRASIHGQQEIDCQSCHNPHAQTPMADTVTGLCTNCHKGMGDTFTHGTHASAGLECSNCHMYTAPRTEDPIGGLIPTGHTFTVGSDACIGCHQDTVHTRDEIIKLTGEVEAVAQVDMESLEQTVTRQEQEIQSLETSANVRLYTGLIQGAIVGLVTGGAAAWVVSRRIRIVEVDEDDEE